MKYLGVFLLACAAFGLPVFIGVYFFPIGAGHPFSKALIKYLLIAVAPYVSIAMVLIILLKASKKDEDR